MRSVLFTFALIAACGVSRVCQAETTWKPVEGKLMTRWAKDVSPDHPLPEYPRPQLVRDQWMNLNGLWEFDIAQPGQAPPIGKSLPKKILVPFAVESALSGLAEKAQEVWYRKTVNLMNGSKETIGSDFTLAPSTGKHASGSTESASASIAAVTMAFPSTSPTLSNRAATKRSSLVSGIHPTKAINPVASKR